MKGGLQFVLDNNLCMREIKMILLLQEKPLSSDQIKAKWDISKCGISSILMMLRAKGIVKLHRKEGNLKFYGLTELVTT